VEALRDALLERHELIGTDITDVLEAARAGARPGARAGAGRRPALSLVIDRTDAALAGEPGSGDR
jgi:cell division protease FtsH